MVLVADLLGLKKTSLCGGSEGMWPDFAVHGIHLCLGNRPQTDSEFIIQEGGWGVFPDLLSKTVEKIDSVDSSRKGCPEADDRNKGGGDGKGAANREDNGGVSEVYRQLPVLPHLHFY